MQKIEIINIGDELLIGQIVNTNASWMAAELDKNGFRTSCVTTISDSAEQIVNTLKCALSHSDTVIITGGLGPTKDDLTKKTLCDFFKSELIENTAVLENITKIFKKRGYVLSETNRAQALVPACCTALMNTIGTAPGMLFLSEGKAVFSLPGVPSEMKKLMQEEVVPFLRQHFKSKPILHKTALTFGIGESFLSDLLEDWELSLPAHLRLAYLPNAGSVLLRLSGWGEDHSDLERQMSNEMNKLRLLCKDYLIGEGVESVEEALVSILNKRKETLSVAESCTGGYLSHLLSRKAAASSFFMGGVVAYKNEVKETCLGVSHSCLENYGAVSEETAQEMAKGVLLRTKSTYALSITGIAGPSGGTEEKPVGYVCIGIAGPKGCFSKQFQFSTDRIQNIERSAYTAMGMLIQSIRE